MVATGQVQWCYATFFELHHPKKSIYMIICVWHILKKHKLDFYFIYAHFTLFQMLRTVSEHCIMKHC